FNLEQASKAGKGFAGLLPELSRGIADTIEAAGPAAPQAMAPPAPPAPAQPPNLSGEKPKPLGVPTPPKPQPVAPPPPPTPGVASTPQVAAPPPPAAAVPSPPATDDSALKGLQSTEAVPREYQTRLLLAIALWTAAVAGGIGLGLVAGQKLYRQQVWPGWREISKAIA